jgi:nucleoside-diphosphate-sugar epimerase
MKVALTGATGYIGSHVLTELHEHGHEVTALVRDDAHADTVAFAGTGKPYIEISGAWVYGNNTSITEQSPFHAPALVAWKEPIERRVLGAAGMRAVVIVSSTAYGDGGGAIPGMLLASPRDDAGNLIMLGTGRHHWSTVHVADLADVFRRVLEDGFARGRYVIGNGVNPTVAELTEAAAVAADAPGTVPGSDEEARAELGWHPSHPALTDEFRHGSYRR